MNERIYALDFLRALMMFFGILLHSFMLQPEIGWLSEPVNGKVFRIFHDIIRAFRMPLFFCLSGYFSCLLFRSYGLRQFLYNRFSRIIGGFAFSLLVFGTVSNYLYYADDSNAEGVSVLQLISKSTASVFGGFKPLHLWYLYYLILFISVAIVLHLPFRQVKAFRIVGKMPTHLSMRVPRYFIILLLAIVPFSLMLYCNSSEYTTTPLSFVLSKRCFLHFFYFFAVGWMIRLCKLPLKQLKPQASIYLTVAVLLTLLRLLVHFSTLGYAVVDFLLSACSTWCFIFGFTGISLSYFNKPSAVLRYLSDAAYWVYLMHLPVIFVLCKLLDEPVPLFTYLLLILLITFVCLFTYNYLVRPTWLGVLLNGKKKKAFPLFEQVQTKFPPLAGRRVREYRFLSK